MKRLEQLIEEYYQSKTRVMVIEQEINNYPVSKTDLYDLTDIIKEEREADFIKTEKDYVILRKNNPTIKKYLDMESYLLKKKKEIIEVLYEIPLALTDPKYQEFLQPSRHKIPPLEQTRDFRVRQKKQEKSSKNFMKVDQILSLIKILEVITRCNMLSGNRTNTVEDVLDDEKYPTPEMDRNLAKMKINEYNIINLLPYLIATELKKHDQEERYSIVKTILDYKDEFKDAYDVIDLVILESIKVSMPEEFR